MKQFSINSMISSFIEEYKATSWFALAWRHFDGECCYRKASKFPEYLKEEVDEISENFEKLKRDFFINICFLFRLNEEEEKDFKRLVKSDDEFWGKYLNHEFDNNEEGALEDFLKKFEKELWNFFKKENK